ncbi:SDR family oxidoreductase [Alkalicoccus halolimnae]|uniref:SDR family oxidoreductase n=1 Tax=Alkalicoccus halolimnae TaxID=1667239 RepID=A0A5C7FDV8_9BACI|nr:SDR family oxidoreductase [Alkalicoccus halolimnae]TXF85487.1 SDR family oxidoreductase [Alkalicoccus halolimnae]
MPEQLTMSLEGETVVITGGSGVLGTSMAEALFQAGAQVAIIGRKAEKAEAKAAEIDPQQKRCLGFGADVLNKNQLEAVRETIAENLGACTILINGAGGNHPKASTSKERFEDGDLEKKDVQSFFDLEENAVNELFQLNFTGTLLPTQVFGQDLIKNKGSIINISSMNADRPLTKIPAYSGAKAAVSNLTQWLAVHFAPVGVRANAISPGFFLTDQNRSLLLNEDGTYTERANKIINQTPEARFGEPEDLTGTLLWLCSKKASGFVNGVIIPVDGGFSAYSGV